MSSFLVELLHRSPISTSVLSFNLGAFVTLLIVSTLVFVLLAQLGKRWTFYRTRDRAIKEIDQVSANTENSIEDNPKNATTPSEVQEILTEDKSSWLTRLQEGLDRSRQYLKDNLSLIIEKKSVLDEELLEQIHEVLYRSDIGADMAGTLVNQLRKALLGQKNPTWNQISEILNNSVTKILESTDKNLTQRTVSPLVILIVGVNGVGKTTSIGKLAARFLSEGKKVLLCAADTYRAAAIDQLQVWGQRLDIPVISHQQGADPASVAFDGVKAAKARAVDVLIIDTAGRLHNKQELMEELSKINKVIGKEMPGAPHETWLVIDSTTGQNAYQQVNAFQQLIKLNGLIVTKLDGTAKGGVVIGVSHKFNVPVRFIGIGEKASDLRAFDAKEFTFSLFSK